MIDTYTCVGPAQKQKWTNAQASILTRSLMITGIAFAIIAGLGYGFGVLFTHLINTNPSIVMVLYSVSFILLFGTIFSSAFVMSRVQTASKLSIVTIIGVYCLAEGIAFGSIFATFDGLELMFIFGFAGIIFLVTGLLGRIISAKATMTLGKILMVASVGFLIVMLISILLSIFGLNSQWWYPILYVGMGILFIGYIAYDVSLISKMSSFIEAQESHVQSNYALVFGFKLLIDLIGLIWVVASFVARK